MNKLTEENVSIDQIMSSLDMPLQVCFVVYPKSGDGIGYVADVQAVMYDRDKGFEDTAIPRGEIMICPVTCNVCGKPVEPAVHKPNLITIETCAADTDEDIVLLRAENLCGDCVKLLIEGLSKYVNEWIAVRKQEQPSLRLR